MIDKLNHYSLNNPASVYDEEALTALELAGRTAAKVNEVVGDQNNLRTETESHLDEQDTKIEDHREYLEQAVHRQDQTIATDINTIMTVTVPSEVKKEMEARIDDGTFDSEIEEHIGILKQQVDNLLTHNLTDEATIEEVADLRTSSLGIVHSYAGESVRHQSTYANIPLKFTTYPHKYISPSGVWIDNEELWFGTSDPIKLNKLWKKLWLYTNVGNAYVGKVVFVKKPTFLDVDTVEVITVDSEGTIELTIPEEAEYVFIGTDTTSDGQILVNVPVLYYNRRDFDLTSAERIGEVTDFVDLVRNGYDEITLDFTHNTGYFNNEICEWIKNDKFSLSDPIGITAGQVYVLETYVGNEYVNKLFFSNDFYRGFNSSLPNYSPMLGDVDNSFIAYKPGRYTFIAPEGYKYMYICSDTDAGGETNTTPRLFCGQTNIADFFYNLSQGSSDKTVTINIPDRYNLIIGKTFELFYKGLIKGTHPLNYDIKITCDMGKVYKRKYSVTPVTAEVGGHELTFTVRDDNGNVLATKTTMLCVNAKPSNPSTDTTVLCIGDSLTAGGEWVSKCSQQLSNAGVTNVRFIGSKTVNGVSFEATAGYGIETYVEQSDNNPFYPSTAGAFSLTDYLTGIGETKVDIVCIFLGWNDRFMSPSEYEAYLNTLMTNIYDEFPDVKFLLFGLQTPDKDGLGESYGASWDFLETVQYVYDHENCLNKVSDTDLYTSRPVNLSGQFDTDYNMPTTTRKVNNRNSTTETVISNGVHPSENGYNQISDVAYCELVAMLKEVE